MNTSAAAGTLNTSMKQVLTTRIFITLVGLITVSSLDANAQSASQSATFWLSAGIGASRAGAGAETDAGGGAALRAALSVQHEALVFTTRWTLNTAGSHPSGGGFSGPANDQFYDLGLLAGYSFNPESNWQAIASMGIALVGGERVVSTGSRGPGGICFDFCGPSRQVHSQSISDTFGIPIEVGVFGNRGNFAVAVIGHVNVNSEASFGGITLNIMTGVLGQ